MQDAIRALIRQSLNTNSGFTISRVNEGVSTKVFKVVKNAEIFYLRLTQENDEMMSPQVLAHKLLLEKGVHVPEIIDWQDDNAEVGPYMLTREIPGASLDSLKTQDRKSFEACVDEVLYEAGLDIARCTTIPVDQYGWIRRDKANVMELKGEVKSYHEFLVGELDKKVQRLKALGFDPLTDDDLEHLKTLVKKYVPETPANLVHGDLDMCHIYVADGHYAGIIDWGDIRGAGKEYDLAHFSAKEGEYSQAFYTGFSKIVKPDDETEIRILLTRMCISLRKLAWIGSNLPVNFINHRLKTVISNDRELLSSLVP